MVSDKKIFKDFNFFLSFVAMATTVFEEKPWHLENSESIEKQCY